MKWEMERQIKEEAHRWLDCTFCIIFIIFFVFLAFHSLLYFFFIRNWLFHLERKLNQKSISRGMIHIFHISKRGIQKESKKEFPVKTIYTTRMCQNKNFTNSIMFYHSRILTVNSVIHCTRTSQKQKLYVQLITEHFYKKLTVCLNIGKDLLHVQNQNFWSQ